MADVPTSEIRSRNVTNNKNDVDTKEKKRQALPGLDKPIHRVSESLLSSASGYTNYRGLLNLCIILLALSNGRMALENILKYGILIDPVQWFHILIKDQISWPAIYITLGSNVFSLLALLLEWAAVKKIISGKMTMRLHVINLINVLLIPALIVHFSDMHPIGSSVALFLYSILFLKLVSYMLVNKWHREVYERKGDKVDKATNGTGVSSLIVYPNNLNVKDMYFFLLVPTLCYELNFPRTTRIRKSFLLKRFIEMLFLFQLSLGLIQQWMVPTIRNSTIPFKEMNYSKLLERLLKLAVPNHLIWLIFFYLFFHSCLNFQAELLKFADREFYRDWWNSETVNYFWQNWNIPVHRWCLRHLYIPMLLKDYTKFKAMVIVFLISAFFHEYLVSIPLKMFRVWAFVGMAAQIPFSIFVERYLTGKLSNMAVWLSLIIGQPLAILMYYHDYYIIHYETPNGTNTTFN